MTKRLKDNKKILEKINKMIEQSPDLRFCQILSYYNLDQDRFYEEPNITLEKMEQIDNKNSIKAEK